MGLSIIAVIMLTSVTHAPGAAGTTNITGALSLRNISEYQHGFIDWSCKVPYFSWIVFKQPIAFMVFLICAFAETNRTPFDLPECEAELVGGYHTEYSSMKLGFYLFAEYINMFISSAVIAVVFFGGYNYPGMDWVNHTLASAWGNTGANLAVFVGVAVLFAKILFFIFFYMWVRWTVPRFRYDQLMNLGWKILIPLSILNIVLTGAAVLLTK